MLGIVEGLAHSSCLHVENDLTQLRIYLIMSQLYIRSRMNYWWSYMLISGIEL